MSIIQVPTYECDKCGEKSDTPLIGFPLKCHIDTRLQVTAHVIHLCDECIPLFLHDICTHSVLPSFGVNTVCDHLPQLAERLGLRMPTRVDGPLDWE